MIHSSSYTVTFAAPFTLPGLDRPYPAGTYTVRTDDEQLDLSFAASRRVATVILLWPKLGALRGGVSAAPLTA